MTVRPSRGDRLLDVSDCTVLIGSVDRTAFCSSLDTVHNVRAFLLRAPRWAAYYRNGLPADEAI